MKDTNKKIKQSNMELLRIISMLMIIALHFLGHGKILNSVSKGTITYYIAWTFETISYISVNLYILISGYFLIDSKFKISKVIKLFFEVLFYSLIIYAFMLIFNIEVFNTKILLKVCTPIISNQYWFVTRYILMYILSPFMNKLINTLNKKEHKNFCFLLVFLCCFVNVIYVILNKGYYLISNNIIWFIVLYIIGAYIKKYDINISTKRGITYYINILITMLLSRFIPEILLRNSNINILKKAPNLFYNYSSILVFLMSLIVFLLFKNIKIENKIINKIILFFGPLTFGVYLIHDNNFVRGWLWENINTTGFMYSSMFVVKMIAIVIIIFIVCSFIEYIRQKLFRILKVDKLANKIEKKVKTAKRIEYKMTKN